MTPTQQAMQALERLITKLDECAPHIQDAALHRQLRCGPYTGPNYAEELSEARSALSRLQSEAEEGWQPISSAPRDGTWIIGLTPHGVVPVRWGVSWYDQHWANGCVVYEPTHFMRLPAPPIKDTDDAR